MIWLHTPIFFCALGAELVSASCCSRTLYYSFQVHLPLLAKTTRCLKYIDQTVYNKCKFNLSKNFNRKNVQFFNKFLPGGYGKFSKLSCEQTRDTAEFRKTIGNTHCQSSFSGGREDGLILEESTSGESSSFTRNGSINGIPIYDFLIYCRQRCPNISYSVSSS